MLRLVGKPEMASDGGPSVKHDPSCLLPLGSSRERLRRYTPEKMMRKPQRSEMVFTAEVVLKPWKRRHDATSVHVVKVT